MKLKSRSRLELTANLVGKFPNHQLRKNWSETQISTNPKPQINSSLFFPSDFRLQVVWLVVDACFCSLPHRNDETRKEVKSLNVVLT
ncbi:hypothetical protein SDJN02_27892, partial [Cucurbita argyrosperma subsp. argyrosperma]